MKPTKKSLRIDNRTDWDDDDLRKLTIAALEARGANFAKVVLFAYARRGSRRLGCAQLPVPSQTRVPIGRRWYESREGVHIRINLPRPPADDVETGMRIMTSEQLARVCATFEHEIDHTLGLRHRDMPNGAVVHNLDVPREWARNINVRLAPPDAPVHRDLVAERKAHALKKLAQWTAKLKRAEYMVRKYTAKVKGYDRREAQKQAAGSQNG